MSSFLIKGSGKKLWTSHSKRLMILLGVHWRIITSTQSHQPLWIAHWPLIMLKLIEYWVKVLVYRILLTKYVYILECRNCFWLKSYCTWASPSNKVEPWEMLIEFEHILTESVLYIVCTYYVLYLLWSLWTCISNACVLSRTPK